MSSLGKALEEHLELRRALGYKLRLSAAALRRFVAFMDREGAEVITNDLALRWASQPADAKPSTWAGRLGMVRVFARHMAAIDPRTEIPPPDLLPYRYQRKAPYIYSEQEIPDLVLAAAQLPSSRGLRGWNYSTLLGLLAVTGMRMSEPIALDRGDVDLEEGILVVRRAKFGKTRLVPIHPTTQEALARYAECRDRIVPSPSSPAFFLSEQGRRLTEWSLRWNFVKASCRCGLREPARSHGHGPRLHDMRHRFAVATLLDWYRAGLDVERNLPRLATYLGHVHVNDTYWYLSATPELLDLAARRLRQGNGDPGP